MTPNSSIISDLQASKLGFGAWPIGGTAYGNISRHEGRAALERYIDLGGRLIDSARGYRMSESIVGEALHSNRLRGEIILASKTKANTPKAMRHDLETSLRELGTDYLDIYYLHQPPADPIERDIALGAMQQFKTEGKIRAIGASISGPNVTEDTERMCRDYIATGKIEVIQLIFSIFRQRLRSILQLAQDHGVGIVGRTALESGFLTGKYHAGTIFPPKDHRNRWPLEKRDLILESVNQVRQLLDRAPQPIDLVSAAIRFAMDEPGIDSVILGAKNAKQAEQTFRIDRHPPIPESVRQLLMETFAGQDALYNLPAES